MNIVILIANSPYKSSGIVALDLQQGFQQNGDNCVILTNYYLKSSDKNVISLVNYIQGKYDKLYRFFYTMKIKFFTKFNNQYYIQEFNQTKSKSFAEKIFKKLPFKPDVFIYLFPQKFLNAKDLYILNKKTNAPILWYMMDMAPFTGGCHYAWDCKRYTKNCGKCPGLFSNKPFDQTYKNWKFKKEFFNKTNIVPIAASEYQYKQLLASSLFKEKNKYKVLLGIDSELFKPFNKRKARKRLHLPLDKKVLFFGAVNVFERRKGFNELIEATIRLKEYISLTNSTKIHLAIAGNMNKNISENLVFKHTFLGYLKHEELALAYQASDVFISPSIEDSGPMMINQSIMSGTPVVAFDIGVALDLVITGKTGYLAKLKDSSDLAVGIKNIIELTETEYVKMSENCRELGLKLCSLIKQGKDFINIIKDNKIYED